MKVIRTPEIIELEQIIYANKMMESAKATRKRQQYGRSENYGITPDGSGNLTPEAAARRERVIQFIADNGPVQFKDVGKEFGRAQAKGDLKVLREAGRVHRIRLGVYAIGPAE